jgi:uncharacterized phage-associated protein
MKIFGFNITRANPDQESLKKELASVKKELAKKEAAKIDANTKAAQPHLKAIERYTEMLAVSDVTRKAELNAIIAQRLAKVESLGVKHGY